MSVAVVGAGAWGTALAATIASDGTDVLLWARRESLAAQINATRRNADYLPGAELPDSVRATADMDALAASPLWLLVVPAQHMREMLATAPLAARPTLLLCSKGIEAGSCALMTEVATEAAPHSPVAVLSGPSFAAEVAAGKPTAVTLAAADAASARHLAARIARPWFRPYASDDRIGAEIGGAVKNVLAIACGVVIGAGLGENARAAIIARGFAEMSRFGLARGARAGTLAGLSGLGDLVLTCGSTQSRNMSLGMAIGQGMTAAQALAGKRTVAEGASTAPVLVDAARRAGVDMPIAEAVADLLADRVTVGEAMERLLSRPLKAEGF